MEYLENLFKHLMEFKLSWGEQASYNYIDVTGHTHKLTITNLSGDGFKVELSIHIAQWNNKSSEELKIIEQGIDDAVNKIKPITY